MTACIRILLISDLHAFASDRGAAGDPSYLDFRNPARAARDDAFVALRELIAREGVKVDVVVCAGDIVDQAEVAAIAPAWAELQAIAPLAGASTTLAVCGNHDLDSRYLKNEDDPDPKGVLQELEPLFPVADEMLCDKYWSRNFVTLPTQVPDTRFLLLNSSAFHGGLEAELKHGRVSRRTIARMRKVLDQEGSRALNVLVCHHHPYEHPQLSSEPDYQSIVNGASLLKLLDEPKYGPWLVLHGHRHIPRIAQASGAVQPPIVIGAATFSRRISEAQNQVHVIEVRTLPSSSSGLCGRVQSYTFVKGEGFGKVTSSRNSLPSACGFGYQGSITSLVSQVAQHVSSQSVAYAQWNDVAIAIPNLRYLNPDQFDALSDQFRTQGLQIAYDDQGEPLQIVRRKP